MQESKTIQYQSSSIFYKIAGKGKTIVLLHGFGEDSDIWIHQIEYLKNKFQIIVPDLPGSGKSQLLSAEQSIGMQDYAHVVEAILTQENINKCILLGHSMGGYIVLAFAQQFPEKLYSFGLIHSTSFADSAEKKQARLKSIQFIEKNGAAEFLQTSIPGLFRENGEQVQQLIEKGRNFTKAALIQYYKAMIARPDLSDVLRNFNGPILLIIGQYDMAIPFDQSLQQTYLPLQSHIHILRNSAHMGMLEQTAEVNSQLLQFIQ